MVGRRAGHERGRRLHLQPRARGDEERRGRRPRLPRSVPQGRVRDQRHGARPVDGRGHLVAPHDQAHPLLHPDRPPAHLEERHAGQHQRLREQGAGRRHRPVPGGRVDQRLCPARPQPALLGQAGRRGRDRHPVLPERPRHDGRRLQEQRARLHPQPERRVVQPAQDAQEHGRPGQRGQRLHPAQLQHLRQGWRRVDDRDPGPGLPPGARLRDRQADPDLEGPPRLRLAGDDPGPALGEGLAHRPDRHPPVQHRHGQPEARRSRLSPRGRWHPGR